MSRKKPDSFVISEFAARLSTLIPKNEKRELAENIGVSYETVRVWFNGKNFPDGATLLKLFKFLRQKNKSIDWLLTGEESTPRMNGKFTHAELDPKPLEPSLAIDSLEGIEDQEDLKFHLKAMLFDLERSDFKFAKLRAIKVIEELEKIEVKQMGLK